MLMFDSNYAFACFSYFLILSYTHYFVIKTWSIENTQDKKL